MGYDKYIAMRESGSSPHDICREAQRDGVDELGCIKLIRAIFPLSFVQAKEVMIQSRGLAKSLDEYQDKLLAQVDEGRRTNPELAIRMAPKIQFPADYEKKLNDFLRRHQILLNLPITDELAKWAVSQIRTLSKRRSLMPITIYINSPGGSVPGCLAIYEEMTRSRRTVHTFGLRQVSGMAALLLAAGTKGERWCLRGTRCELTPVFCGEKWDFAKREEIDEMHDRVATILARCTGQSPELVRADMSMSALLDAKGALRYGLVDKIVDSPENPEINDDPRIDELKVLIGNRVRSIDPELAQRLCSLLDNRRSYGYGPLIPSILQHDLESSMIGFPWKALVASSADLIGCFIGFARYCFLVSGWEPIPSIREHLLDLQKTAPRFMDRLAEVGRSQDSYCVWAVGIAHSILDGHLRSTADMPAPLSRES